MCAATESAIEPGEAYYSVLQIRGGETVRIDYRADAWNGPPENCLGWWRSRVPTTDGAKARLAPRDVLLNLFAKLAELPDELEFRYVLALVLLRRRILRLEDSQTDRLGCESMTLSCPQRDQHFDVQVVVPNQQRAKQLQQRLVELLYGDSESE